MSTNQHHYNGWKIKKGNTINVDAQAFKIAQMDWYEVGGINVFYIGGSFKGVDTIFDFESLVQNDLVILPEGVKKNTISQLKPFLP